MSPHTPGPWKMEPDRSTDRCEVYISSDLADDAEGGWSQFATVVVRMLGDNQDEPDGIANAKLITAAPALADALYEAGVQLDLEAENYRDEDGLYQPHGKKLAGLADMTRAALRKAGRLP